MSSIFHLLKNIIQAIFLKILKKYFGKDFIKRIDWNCKQIKGKALLYFKTDPFINKKISNKYTHTNNWEILEIVKILNQVGYNVDVIDRTINQKKIKNIKDEYTIYIGLGAGSSGKYFKKIALQIPSAKKILFAAGPNPDLSNKLMIKRYKYFSNRHKNKKLTLKRMINNVNIDEFMKYSDAIFVVGNEFSINSYKKYKKPIYRIYPSSSPKIKYYKKKGSETKNFLYFGGNGNLVKGLDLLYEVFNNQKINLYACGPSDESDFNSFYKPIIEKNKNIHFEGFILVGSKKFNELTKKCGFIILPSCSEGTATSVTTCMRAGLIPIVTPESGIDIKDFGFQIKDIKIKNLRTQIINISNIKDNEFIKRSEKTYIESKKYTQENFSKIVTKALKSILKN